MGFAHAYAQVTLEARGTTYYVGGTCNGTKSDKNKYCPVISCRTVYRNEQKKFYGLPRRKVLRDFYRKLRLGSPFCNGRKTLKIPEFADNKNIPIQIVIGTD